ncbi:hypothetical protein ACFLU6_06565 [Acidobacteriota bacterium]
MDQFLRKTLFFCVVLWAIVFMLLPGTRPGSCQAYDEELVYSGSESSVWSMRSPYPSLSQTKQLLDMIELKLLLSYQRRTEADGFWRITGQSGVEDVRYYDMVFFNGVERTLELAIFRTPEGAYDLFLYGQERGPQGIRPNPDLMNIQGNIDLIAVTIMEEEAQDGFPVYESNLKYEMYQLSYIKSDHAIGLLKSLGYSTIEYEVTDAESIYDKIYSPIAGGSTHLPIIVKIIDAEKTSLQEPAPMEASFRDVARAGSLLPDLGGVFLHQVTSGDPQQRLLIIYDPEDLNPLEDLMNLLRNKIDIPAQQIIIEALVIEMEATHAKDLGVSFGVSGISRTGRYEDKYSVETGTPFADTDDRSLVGLFDRTGVLDTFKFNMAVHALVEEGQAKILSNPSVLVLDGRQAKIQIGNQIPVPEQTLTVSGSTAAVTYFPVGIVLNLRPRINETGDEILMQVETIVSSVVAFNTLAEESGLTAPEVASRVVQTFVRVANDTPFIIGGLTTTNDVKKTTGVPVLSKIPGIGALFRRNQIDEESKEIIIVLTPHIVRKHDKGFSYVIPQETEIFDSFGHQLFYNAYRVRHQDVYDLDFLYSSKAYQSLVACMQDNAEGLFSKDVPEELTHIMDRGVPGEDILVRRMLWEIITRSTNYDRFVDESRMIFFDKTADGTNVSFLLEKLPLRARDPNTLVLTFDARMEGTPEHPFVQPAATVSYEHITRDSYLRRLSKGNTRGPDGEPDKWTIMLTEQYGGTAHPRDILKGVLVLKRMLDLNPNLPLTLKGFYAGRQIVFPTESDLRERYHLVDGKAAKLFYEVTQYYPAFEEAFKIEANHLAEMVGGCTGWETGQYVLGDSAPELKMPATAKKKETKKTAHRPASVQPIKEKIVEPQPPPAVTRTEHLPNKLANVLEKAKEAVETAPMEGRSFLYASLDGAKKAFGENRVADGYVKIGRLYLDTEMNHAAIENLNKAMKQGASSEELHLLLAEAYRRIHRNDKARRHVELASRAAN